MPTNISIQSFNQILGSMLRTIIAQTPLNDINAGSVLLTLLEAAAAQDFENSTAILNILELLDIDAVRNSDLDSRAGDYGLTRYPSVKASGFVNISNSAITKQSTGLYVIQPAPIAGQTVLYVNNTTGWAHSGTLFIGRGTANFEGPIPYTSINVYATYSQINLGSALQNNHLVSETVINSQGEPDRIVNAGTVISIPANNLSPAIQYTTLRDAVIPAGEVIVTNIPVIAQVAGSLGNAGYNTITLFSTLPFAGATVTNTISFTNGADTETDTNLRNRIKAYTATLARGTATSIINAVIGISDAADNKQVVSAVISEPPAVGQPSVLYIDDGTGFQPSFAGQSVDPLLTNAKGTEEFLQLSNYPVTRPQVINTALAPFKLVAGSFLRVVVDGVSETVVFENAQFVNINSATLAEIIAAINGNAKTFSARFTNNSLNLLLYPTAFDTERFQVSPLLAADDPVLYANTQLQFATDEVSYIALFQNSDRLREKAISATLETASFGSWNINAPGDLIVSVDGTPTQDRAFALSDFVGASSFSALALTDWVAAFNTKFAGLTATATAAQTMLISSNLVGTHSNINIVGGSYLNNWFAALPTTATGQTAQFELNRQTGNLRILNTIHAGDSITAGVADARGYVISTPTPSGFFNISSDIAGRVSTLIVVPDASYCLRRSLSVPVGSALNILNPSGTVMRVVAPSIAMFQGILPGDFLFISSRTTGWLNTANTGLFKVFSKGGHTVAGTDTYIDVENMNVVPQSGLIIQDALDVKAFTTDGYPQVWLGTFGNNPPSDSISDFVLNLNNKLINVNATIFKTNSIKLTSNTELNGSIAVPVSAGPMSSIFLEKDIQVGNAPLIANRVSSKSLISYFKPTPPISNTVGYGVWLNRQIWTDTRGALTGNSMPDAAPYLGTYSETLTSTSILNTTHVDYNDYIFLTRGNNRGQFRSIASFTVGDEANTQEGLARTNMNHTIGDEFEIIEPVQLSTDDTMVVVMDQDPTNNTIDIAMARTGQINSGSASLTFLPTSTEFSANDFDNQPGIDFSNTTVWGTLVNNTNFSDYAVWMRAHNWYAGGGLSSGQGKMIVRAYTYGPNGESVRFGLSYPSLSGQTPTTLYQNTPSWGKLTYVFGSGPARAVAIPANTTISVDGPYPDATTNFPNGVVSSGNYFDYTFGAGTFTSVVVGDVLTINPGSGVSNSNSGTFVVQNINGHTVRVYNLTGTITSSGAPTITTVTTVPDVTTTPQDTHLLTASTYGILAHSTITNAVGTSVVNGSMGIYPGTSITGAFTVSGSTDVANTAAHQAQTDATAAFTALQTLGLAGTVIPSALDGQTLSPGAYQFSSGAATLAATLSGTLTFNGAGTYIIYTASTLVTGAGGTPTITLTNGASAANIYWVVGSSATINSGSSGTFVGNIIAQTSITDTMGGVINGRLIALTGAVTLSAIANITTPSNGIGIDSLNGTYFLLYDHGGPVSVWYDVNNQGTLQPFDGSYRNIRVGSVTSGMSAISVADATVQALNADSAFTATNVGGTSNIVTIDTAALGYFGTSSANTSGFTVHTTNGSLPADEILSNVATSAFSVFPLAGNDVATIVSTVNAGEVIELVAVGSPTLTINLSTAEDHALAAYNFTSGNSYIQLYDGVNWIKSFENPNPNFTLKVPYLLQGVAPSIYSMDTTPNSGISTLGELFKLIPVTIQNVYHQMTQKALSQLPIVADVRISDDRKNVQITSNKLGSAGSIEVIGGNANISKAYLTAESEVSIDSSGSYLLTTIPAYPDTFNAGDVVMVGNDTGVQRLSRLQASDTMSVSDFGGANFDYNYNPKAINVSGTTSFSITDVSSVYGRPAGFVWRWTDTTSPTPATVLTNVNAGDLVYAFGSTLTWAQGNKVKEAGDNGVAGLPIINVHIGTGFSDKPYFDVVNPDGVAMSSTVVGSGNTVQICPTPVIRWNLAHAAKVLAFTISAVSDLITVNTTGPHYLNTGDSVQLVDSLNMVDGTYGPITVVNSTQFTFAHTIANFTENSSGASIVKSGLTPTRYRLEKLNVNGLVRIQRQDGASPHFTDCGVAVDDYIVISGTTFSSNNNGIFRVLAVDTDTLMLINTSATDQLNTITPFNNNGLQATWTSNTNIVTGVAGTFKDVVVGSWVKQSTDSDSLYLEVLSMTPSTPALATSITLGGSYGGASDIGAGVVYDEVNNYDKGVYLQNADDITIYEGDAAFAGDTFTIQNIIDPTWFSPANMGTFLITVVGTDTATYKPFVRVVNANGIVESNRLLSVSVSGIYITESLVNKFYSIRTVGRVALDDADQTKRLLYMPQWSRFYKFTKANGSSITHMGKLGYTTDITIGKDGYTYYTGLLQKVQWTVDGYEPDLTDYPGQRAVGGLIETLPALVYPITLALTVATNNGVNLNDVSNQIISVIINYIEGLSVGAPVVMSQIIANVMSINGVASIIFTTPTPSTASITVGSNQKATISASSISIS